MNYLLDTCVLSEFTRRQPDRRVIAWLDSVDEANLYLSVITLGEIQFGIERLAESPRKADLLRWLNEDLLERFTGRILDLDTLTMLRWGTLTAHLQNSGRPAPVMDSLIAATALHNNLVVVTRNADDFTLSGVEIKNPWQV